MFEFTLSQALNSVPTVSPSQIAKWHDCRKAWEYSYRQQLRKTGGSTFYMDRGTYFHRLLHYYYHLLEAGFKPGTPTVINAMEQKIQEDLKELTVDNVKILSTTLPHFSNYFSNHSASLDKNIKVVGVEKELFLFKLTPKGRGVFLHGIVDLIFRNTYGKLKVLDHKTGERADTWSDGKVDMELQLYFYQLLVEGNFGEPVDEVGINFINLAKNPEHRFQQYGVHHSIAQLKEFERELLMIIDLMFDEQIYRRYNKDCKKCSFFRICNMEQQGLNPAAVISTGYERSNRKPSVISQLELRTGTEEGAALSGLPNRNEETTTNGPNLSGWDLNLNLNIGR